MVIVKMNDNGPVTNGLGEHIVLVQDHCNHTRDGLTGEGQDLSEEDESRINEDMEDLNNGNTEKVQGQTHGQAVRERQQPLGPKVNWESFLPQRSLKVLLVENDDSTRHVVCALLQNCGYEVTAVSNALQACKILEDPRNHIDLVLTEVVLPCLSGVGLLCKMMSHKTWKTIPVIMMSSHDSMGIVFKCLSKGAVDFLVKPIRKNELKNFWQHVWRKCHSSSGSGSESGIRTEKSTKSRSYYQSGSNNGKEAGSINLTSQDGSDSRSGIQSSWTKRAIEVDSPQPASPEEQLADPPDSTCAQAIHTKLEGSASNGVPVTMARECNLWDDGVDNVEMGKDLEMGVPNATIPVGEHTENVQNNKAGASKENFEVPPEDDDQEHGQLKLDSEKPSGNSFQDADLIGIDTNMSVTQLGFNITSGRPKVSDTKEDVIYDKGMPSLELSLKRVKDFGDTGTPIHECNVLRHSDFSAFSRYTSGSAAQKVPTEILGSCSPLDSSSEAAKTDQAKHLQSISNSMPPNQRSNGSSNNEDMGSTTNNAFTKIKDFSDQQAPKSSVEQNGMVSTMQPRVQNSADASLAKMLLVHTKHMEQQVQVQHHHHHYHHYHHHLHEKPQQPDGLDDLSMENMAAAAASQYGSSNMSSVPHFEGNAGNNSLNGSASGSNNGSNGQNGSGTAVNTGGMDIKCEDLILVTDGPGTATGFGDRSGIDFNRSSQREAALYKFRQKRKQRCFEKKVRYQSRKKLAEQRPRIRGQFVRQAQDSSNGTQR